MLKSNCFDIGDFKGSRRYSKLLLLGNEENFQKVRDFKWHRRNGMNGRLEPGRRITRDFNERSSELDADNGELFELLKEFFEIFRRMNSGPMDLFERVLFKGPFFISWLSF
jgi:hypothetical protein